MGGWYLPTGDSFAGSHWSPSPSSPFLFQAVDEPALLNGRLTAPSVLVHDGAGGVGFDDHRVLFSFTLPFSTNSDLAQYQLSGVTLRVSIRALFAGADVVVNFSARRAGIVSNFSPFTYATGPFLPGPNPTPWAITLSSPTTDPFTGAAWTVTDLLATSFGFYLPNGGSGNVLEVANFSMEVDERTMIGEARAPLSPRLGEPAHFCSVCSKPLHLSALIRVSDDEHPQFGRLVCPEDYDIDPTDRDAEADRLNEGDIDFEDSLG